MREEYSPAEITKFVQGEFKLVGNTEGVRISSLKPAGSADPDSLAFIDAGRSDTEELARSSEAGTILAEQGFDVPEDLLASKCFVLVPNPKLTFIRVVQGLHARPRECGVHSTAFVHPESTIHPTASIGPFCYVGRSEIGENAVLDGRVFVYDGVRIGKNVKIQAGCVIGSEQVNITKDENGKWVQFPHIGGVVIEEDVSIDALCHIGRGTLGDTVIGAGTKIDCCTYIAHNSTIGEDNIIIGHSMLCGSVTTGDNCWIGPGSTLRDRIKIGSDCMIGMGSLVVKDLASGSEVMGSPAEPIDEFKKRRRSQRPS